MPSFLNNQLHFELLGKIQPYEHAQILKFKIMHKKVNKIGWWCWFARTPKKKKKCPYFFNFHIRIKPSRSQVQIFVSPPIEFRPVQRPCVGWFTCNSAISALFMILSIRALENYHQDWSRESQTYVKKIRIRCCKISMWSWILLCYCKFTMMFPIFHIHHWKILKLLE